MYTWGAVLWVVVQDKPMVYEQEEVADSIVMRHGLMGKKLILLNPQIETNKPQIWQLVSSITIWYIWKARCLKVLQNVTERPAQIFFGILTEIVHNLRGLLDSSIKGNTQQAKLKQWELCDLPKGRKVIATKWIYTIKCNGDGSECLIW